MKIKFYEGKVSLNDNMLDFETITSELRNGKPILVFDQKDREGETDIFFSAKYVSNSSIKFLRKNGGGMIFLAAENSASTKLGLPFAHQIYESAGDSNKNFNILVSEKDKSKKNILNNYSFPIGSVIGFAGLQGSYNDLFVKNIKSFMNILY